MNDKCSPFFEWDTANDGGVHGNGWCGCGGKSGNQCQGADAGQAATNSIYHVLFEPSSNWGAIFLLLTGVAAVLYIGGGLALGRHQRKASPHILATHPHYAGWIAMLAVVQDGMSFTATTSATWMSRGARNYSPVPDAANKSPTAPPVLAASTGEPKSHSDSDEENIIE